MLPTPSTSHVSYNRIYEPAEDSFLLLDTLSSASETAFLRERFDKASHCPLVLEVGTGSGVVLSFVTAYAEKIIGRTDVFTLAIDVNEHACVATVQTVQIALNETQPTVTRNATFLGCLQSDLTAALKPGSVDVLIFNPPYVPSETLPSMPTDPRDLSVKSARAGFLNDSQLLALSTDGGVDGMEITDRLLAELDTVLSHRGVAYILLCAQNKPDGIMSRLRAQKLASGAWAVEKVASSGNKAGWEKLCVIRIWRTGT